MEMAHFVGLDVSVKETSVCVVDNAGKVVLEQKIPTEPADIIGLLTSLGVSFGRIGIEAGPLSQWLVNALTAADLPVICVETRHMKALLTAQQVNKTDRNDARGTSTENWPSPFTDGRDVGYYAPRPCCVRQVRSVSIVAFIVGDHLPASGSEEGFGLFFGHFERPI